LEAAAKLEHPGYYQQHQPRRGWKQVDVSDENDGFVRRAAICADSFRQPVPCGGAEHLPHRACHRKDHAADSDLPSTPGTSPAGSCRGAASGTVSVAGPASIATMQDPA
jgi:hypothetical protein